MTDYNAYFLDLISKLLSGQISRADAATAAGQIGMDEIEGGAASLLTNCEWALRHANEPDFYTSEQEFGYLLACLQGRADFSVLDRDAAILGLSRDS